MIILALVGFFFALLVALGTGGGMLLVPVLTEIFLYSAEEARSIVLLLYVPISLLVSYYNIKNGYFMIEFKQFVVFIVVGAFGVFIGNIISDYIEPESIKHFYSFSIISIGIYQIFNTLPIRKTKQYN